MSETARRCHNCDCINPTQLWLDNGGACSACDVEAGYTVIPYPCKPNLTSDPYPIKPSFHTTTAIESPYAGDVAANLEFLDECIKHCMGRGETPYASHKMLTTALNDDYPEQRKLGIEAGLSMAIRCDKRRFYAAKGWSKGMLAAREYYDQHGLDYEVKF